jgi:hypothetical protein
LNFHFSRWRLYGARELGQPSNPVQLFNVVSTTSSLDNMAVATSQSGSSSQYAGKPLSVFCHEENIPVAFLGALLIFQSVHLDQK